MRRRVGLEDTRSRSGPARPRRCTCRTTTGSASTPRTPSSWRRSSGTSSITPASQRPAAAALPPAGDLPLPGAQAGGRRAGAAAPGRRVHARGEAEGLRVLRPAHDRRLDALGGRAVDHRGGDRLRRGSRSSTSSRRSTSTWPTCTATRPTASTSPRPAASGAPSSSASAACATGAGATAFDPRLPEDWERLEFRITLRGSRIRVELRRETMTFTLEEGEGADVEVRGETVAVRPGEPSVVALDGQGPRLTGVPSTSDLEGSRREDGSLHLRLDPDPRAGAARGGRGGRPARAPSERGRR